MADRPGGRWIRPGDDSGGIRRPAGQVWRGQLALRAPSTSRPASFGGQLARPVREVRCNFTTEDGVPNAVSPAWRSVPVDDPAHDAVAMTLDDVAAAVESFVAAAVRAEQAGFDGVEVHGAHGYLLGQFLDTSRNDRADGYGGSPDGRFRIVCEVLAGIRAATRSGFQLGLRLSPEGFGTTVQDGREYARQALESDLLDYSICRCGTSSCARAKGGDALLIDHFVDLPRGEARLGVTGKREIHRGSAVVFGQGSGLRVSGTRAIVHHDFAARALADPQFVAAHARVGRRASRGEGGPAFVGTLPRRSQMWWRYRVTADGQARRAL